jgi:hypothetical protein
MRRRRETPVLIFTSADASDEELGVNAAEMELVEKRLETESVQTARQRSKQT